jgi:Spy/CpxP family protein refolding chaperone
MKLNKMLVLSSLAAGSMLACGSAFGQGATITSMTTNATTHMSHMFGGANMDKLSQELGLSDSQKQKVQSIFQSEHQQMRDVHQNTTMSTGERRSETEKIRDSLNTKLQSVLTPEQYSKWQNLTHQHTALPNTAPPASPPQ